MSELESGRAKLVNLLSLLFFICQLEVIIKPTSQSSREEELREYEGNGNIIPVIQQKVIIFLLFLCPLYQVPQIAGY